MLHVPDSLAGLLSLFRPWLTEPSFRTFRALVVGFIARVGEHTITGCLLASGMAPVWHHSRAHRFFSRARWSADRLGLVVAELVVERLLSPDAPLLVALDDTVLRRSGRKVSGCAWHHNPTGEGIERARRLAWGNCWVVAGLVIWLPFSGRPVCLPVLFRLWRKNKPSPSKHDLARELIEVLAARFAGRRIEVVGDSAYVGAKFADLPDGVTLTARLRVNAALQEPIPPRTGKAGRPRKMGPKLPPLVQIAEQASDWRPVQVRRYGQLATVLVHRIKRCMWYTVFGSRDVTVLLIRELGRADGYDFALVSTDTDASTAQLIERIAARWSIEVSFQDAKQLAGVGQARNRTRLAVERTVPFGFLCLSLTIAWYALHGHDPADVAEHRARARWYTTKRSPSLADMLAKLRRTIIAARYSPVSLRDPTPQEIHAVQQAWAAAGC